MKVGVCSRRKEGHSSPLRKKNPTDLLREKPPMSLPGRRETPYGKKKTTSCKGSRRKGDHRKPLKGRPSFLLTTRLKKGTERVAGEGKKGRVPSTPKE